MALYNRTPTQVACTVLKKNFIAKNTDRNPQLPFTTSAKIFRYSLVFDEVNIKIRHQILHCFVGGTRRQGPSVHLVYVG